jgi:hypothetical protein
MRGSGGWQPPDGRFIGRAACKVKAAKMRAIGTAMIEGKMDPVFLPVGTRGQAFPRATAARRIPKSNAAYLSSGYYMLLCRKIYHNMV